MKPPSFSLRWLAATALAAAAACTERSREAPLFEGAKPLDLACVRERRPPTRPELEALVAAVVETAGGEAALRKLTFHRVEDLYLRRSGDPQSNHVLVETWFRHDLTLRTELQYHSGEVEQRVLWHGEEYLSSRGLPLQIGTGANQQFVEWDWQVARLPLWLLEASALTPLPLREEDGRVFVAFHAEVEGWHPEFDVLVDPRGPCIAGLEAMLPITGDMVTRMSALQRVRFSDFRRVDGILFAFRRDLTLDGARYALGETREVATGGEFDEPVFFPQGKPAPPK